MAPREPYLAAGPQRAGSPLFKILCVTNINDKISDETVKDALSQDFSRFGDISVSVCHDNGERLAYVYFRSYQQAREARLAKSKTLFFERPIEVEPIYEPPSAAANGSPPPPEMSPPTPLAPQVYPMYSPQRGSLTPPEYAHESNGASMTQRRPSSMQPHPSSQLAPVQRPPRGLSPSEYHLMHSGEHANGRPPAMAAYDRGRDDYSYYPPTNMPSHSAYPPAQPPHDPYRSPAYLPRPPPQYPPYNHAPPYSNLSPYAPEAYSRQDRYIGDGWGYPAPSRSPHGELYHPDDSRFPYPSTAPAYHQSSSSRGPVYPYGPGPFPPPMQPGSHYPPSANRRTPPPHSSHPPEPSKRYGRSRRGKGGGGDRDKGDNVDGRPSRVLIVNNIDCQLTESDLRAVFEPFGLIEEMELKKVSQGFSSALIKFSSMDGAYKAKIANNGHHIGSERCRIVYGKVSASRRLWMGGLSSATTKSDLEEECSKFGEIIKIDYSSGRPYAYVEYKSANQAQFAAHHLSATLTPAVDRKIRIEFVDPERSERISSKVEMDVGLRSRANNSAWIDTELSNTSPQSLGTKRSLTPTDSSCSKRQVVDAHVTMNTFKQEHPAATMGRLPSSRSSTPSEHQNSDEVAATKTKNSDLSNKQYNESEREALGDEQDLASCTSIQDIIQCCPVSWSNDLVLKNFIFPSRLFLWSGQSELIDRYLSSSESNEDPPMLKITQRWRLHPQPKLDEVRRRMQVGNLGMLIIVARPAEATSNQKQLQNGDASKSTPTLGGATPATPATPVTLDNKSDLSLVGDSNKAQISGSATGASPAMSATVQHHGQSKALRNLITYLEQKDAAGVISLSRSCGSVPAAEQQQSSSAEQTSLASKLLYVFPPCEFALDLIQQKAPNINFVDILREKFLLGVIVGGGNVVEQKA